MPVKLQRLRLSVGFQLPLHWKCVSYTSGRGCSDIPLPHDRDASILYALTTLLNRGCKLPVNQAPVGRLDEAEVAGPEMMPSTGHGEILILFSAGAAKAECR